MEGRLTPEEAKEKIDAILKTVSPECEIIFQKKTAEIINSYKVDKKEIRHKICKLIEKTGLTGRNYESLSAEWEVHNVAWKMHVGRASAKDVSLDYTKDPRLPVRAATWVFDKLDIE